MDFIEKLNSELNFLCQIFTHSKKACNFMVNFIFTIKL